MVQRWSVQLRGWTRYIFLQGMENATMPRVKQASKRKRVTKAAAPALGAAGLTFSLVGGASASAVPTTDVTPIPNIRTDARLSRSVKRKSPTSAWQRSISSTRKTAAAGSRRLLGAAAVAAEVAEAAELAGPADACAGCAGCRRCCAQLPRRLLPIVGTLPLCARPGSLLTLTNTGRHGRVRRGRPGQFHVVRLRSRCCRTMRSDSGQVCTRRGRMRVLNS